jgi:hypothetical protein
VRESTTVTVFITVDTEEDAWGDYASRSPGVTNIAQLPTLQALCDRYGAIPTYLINRPVAIDDAARDMLRDFVSGGHCEIGTHIHPWNTPPVLEPTDARHSMLCNLPDQLIHDKLAGLHALIADRIGVTPRSFRAGRWGFSGAVARTLVQLGYRVDTSVSPLVDWTPDSGPDYREAPSHAYRLRPADPMRPVPAGDLVEIPATVGFLRGNPARRMRLREWALRPVPRRLRMVGVFERLGLAALRWLSPEGATGAEMIRLARTLVAGGARFLNLSFHSPTLVPGLTPFVRTEGERRQFHERIEQFLAFARASGFRFEPLGRGPEVLGLSDGAAVM